MNSAIMFFCLLLRSQPLWGRWGRYTAVSAKGFRQRSKGVWEKVGGAPPAFPGPGGSVEPKSIQPLALPVPGRTKAIASTVCSALAGSAERRPGRKTCRQ